MNLIHVTHLLAVQAPVVHLRKWADDSKILFAGMRSYLVLCYMNIVFSRVFITDVVYHIFSETCASGLNDQIAD